MVLTHLNGHQAGTNAVLAPSQARARTCRRSSPIPIAYWQRSAPGWLGNGNQKPSPLPSRTADCERGTHDQQAEAIERTRSPTGIARSLRTISSSCSSMQTASALGARARQSICTLGQSNESSHTLNQTRTPRLRFGDLVTADGRLEFFATTKPPTFDGLWRFTHALSNALAGVLSNRLGGPT